MLDRPRFYVDDIPVGGVLNLAPDQSRHLLKVLRAQEKDELELFDGKGSVGQASLVKIKDRTAIVEIFKVEKTLPPSELTLCFGLSKPPALEFIIKRLTEVGVQGFQPLVTAHSERRPWKQERWEKIIKEVSKQSQLNWLPTLYAPLDLKTWLSNRNTNRFLVFCDENHREKKLSQKIKSEIDVLVGPEGGWSPEERQMLLKIALPMGLGSQRLRTETACLAAALLLG